jgi:hypothetical protein
VSVPNHRPTPVIVQRRSQRIMLSVPVLIRGELPDGRRFAEETTTLVVNAHGALVQMKQSVQEGQSLEITNAKTREESSCTVRDVTVVAEGPAEVGLEFDTPHPRFWHVAFPPTDWSSRSPEAKRFATPPPIVPKPAK